MRILIDGRMVTEKTHGIGRYTVDLVNGLKELGQSVSVVITDEKNQVFFGPKSVDSVVISKTDFANPLETLSLSALNVKDFDAVHFPSFAVPLVAQWDKAVITVHDLIHLKEGGSLRHKIYYHTVLKRALQKAAHIIAVSRWTKDEIVNTFKIPSDKISVVRNGLEKKWFISSENSHLEENSIIVLGNIKNHKNIITLIKACREIWKTDPQLKLKISLGGSDLPAEWGVSESEKSKIKVLKNLSDEDLKKEIKSSKALVSPSIFEGFNYPAAEALAQGKTVILSRGSAHDELQGEGILFYGSPQDEGALAKAIKEVLKNPSSPSPRKNYSRSNVDMAQETLEIYRRLQ